LARFPSAVKRRPELSQTPLTDGVAEFAHELQDVMEIVQRVQSHSQHFFSQEEMTQIGA
jgi:hypothetical protein